MQRPPVFSALKVKGRRAYALARLRPGGRTGAAGVTIERLKIMRYAYPEFVLEVTCSSGTYIRSLGRDIGEVLGSAAVMSALQRTAIGPFTLDQACTLRELSPATIKNLLLPAARAVEHFPRVDVTADDVVQLGHGRFISGSLPAGCAMAAAIGPDGQLVALLAAAPEGGLKPHRYFRRG